MGQSVSLGQVAAYLHIPFCLTRCPYCSFFSQPYSLKDKQKFLASLSEEIRLFQESYPALRKVATLYFGGGTPSLVSPEEISAMCAQFDLAPLGECSLEINPLQITDDYLSRLSQTPVNRLSIGVQSLLNDELALLGRRHRSEQILAKVELCRRHGFANISLDLLYGLPGSTPAALEHNLAAYLEMRPEHISAYLLTLEDDAPLKGSIIAGSIPVQPGDEALSDQYYAIRQTLLDAGYEQYEISNYCLPGYASQHNLFYWKSRPWLALGPSAAGWLPPYRYVNPPDLEAYNAQILAGNIMPDAEFADSHQTARDHLMMGLRLLEGLDLGDFEHRYGLNLLQEKADTLARLGDLGLIVLEGDRLRLSPEALFVSNAVIGELL